MTLNAYLLIKSCFFKHINSRQFIHFLLILIDCFVYAAVSLRERLCNSYSLQSASKTATEDGYRLEISDLESRGVAKTKALQF